MPRGVYQRTKEVEVNVSGAGADINIPVEGDINRDDLETPQIETHRDMVGFEDKARMLAFMEEPVEIYLQESTNPAEEPAVFLQVSGEPALPHQPWLLRGRQYTLKRKFVAQLLTARTISYTQPFKADADPAKVNVMRPQVGMRYPFSVINDSPAGHRWIQQMMGR